MLEATGERGRVILDAFQDLEGHHQEQGWFHFNPYFGETSGEIYAGGSFVQYPPVLSDRPPWNDGVWTDIRTFVSALGSVATPARGPTLDLPLPEGVNRVQNLQTYQRNDGENQNWTVYHSRHLRPYVFVSRANRKVLDVPNYTTAEGRHTNQYTYNGGTNQMWEFVQQGTAFLVDGRAEDNSIPEVGANYFIRSTCNGKVLQFRYAETSYSPPVQQGSYWGGENQLWLIETGRNDSFKFRNVNTGLYLTISNATDQDGTFLVGMRAADGSDANKEWWPKAIYEPFQRLLVDF